MEDVQSVSLDSLVLCACEGREYKARDAIDGAVYRGEIGASWKEFLRGVKADKRAEELDLELDQEAVDSAAEAFRYERDLITAEETEQWLRVRGLDLDDFGDYIARQYWVRAATEEVEPDDVDLISASADLRELFVAELILSGQLDLLTTALMWRLAAHAADANENPDPGAVAAERQRFLDRSKITDAELPDWLNSIGRDALWLEEMLAWETGYRRRIEMVLNPQSRRKELAMTRMPLTRFEANVVEVESRDAAREIMLCIREDGMSMEEAAAEGRYPYRSVVFLRQDVPADLQQKFLSVSAGDILDPVARGDGFELYQITGKVEPDPDDPAVKSRLDERLLERHFSELVSKHVEPRLPSVVSER